MLPSETYLKPKNNCYFFFLQIAVLEDHNTRLEFVLVVISGSDINQDWEVKWETPPGCLMLLKD